MSRPGSEPAGPGGRALRPRPTGRSFLTFAALALAALGLLLMIVAFLWPPEERHVDVGHLDRFEPGTVTSFRIVEGRAAPMGEPPRQRVQPRHGVHLVRLDDGKLHAFSWSSTHLGRAVEWRPDSEWEGHRGLFVDVSFGWQWSRDGTVLWGAPPRGLDGFEVTVTEQGRVVVDLARVIAGERRPRSPRGATPTPVATPSPTPPR